MYRTSEETQKRKDEKRQLILDTAAKVFASKGYRNTTVNDIVKESNTSVGSFYFYFDSKEGLFIELYKSIVKSFNDVIASVIDVENNSMLKNFTRVMTATLWMYENKRDIARIILLETVSSDPAFQKLESDRMRGLALVMTDWFKRFKRHSEVYIPDERVAALMYAGTYYSYINDCLTSNESGAITACCYEFCVYNLQALRIAFEEKTVQTYINEVLKELSAYAAA